MEGIDYAALCHCWGGEHKHLYFTLRPAAFSREFWGEAPEELELVIRDSEPGQDENGVLVFIGD